MFEVDTGEDWLGFATRPRLTELDEELLLLLLLVFLASKTGTKFDAQSNTQNVITLSLFLSIRNDALRFILLFISLPRPQQTGLQIFDITPHTVSLTHFDPPHSNVSILITLLLDTICFLSGLLPLPKCH